MRMCLNVCGHDIDNMVYYPVYLIDVGLLYVYLTRYSIKISLHSCGPELRDILTEELAS